jgi:hypothetical protein
MRALRIAPLLALTAAFAASPLSAQGNCFPDKDSREAKLFAHFSAPLAFGPGQAPWIYRPASVHLSLEGTLLPDASDRIATPTTCRPGKEAENVNILPGFVRPRVAYSLPHGVLLEASWVPPIRVDGVKANLFGLALSRSVPFNRSGALLMGRVHATFGSIHAPITCPDESLDDAASECFQGTRSDDRLSPNIFGVELALGFPMARGRFRPYAGAGYNILHPRFQVHFRNSLGSLDNRKVEVNLSRIALFGGATLAMGRSFLISGEAYSTPSDLVTARARMTLVMGGVGR